MDFARGLQSRVYIHVYSTAMARGCFPLCRPTACTHGMAELLEKELGLSRNKVTCAARMGCFGRKCRRKYAARPCDAYTHMRAVVLESAPDGGPLRFSGSCGVFSKAQFHQPELRFVVPSLRLAKLCFELSLIFELSQCHFHSNKHIRKLNHKIP